MVYNVINVGLKIVYHVGISFVLLILALVMVILLNSIIEQIFGFSILQKVYTKSENYYNKNKNKNMLKKIKKKIDKHNRKGKFINYNALKFEYRYIVDLVCEVVSDVIKNKNEQENDIYILKFDGYFREIKSIRDVNQNSIEAIACLVKAIIKEPIVSDSNLNREIILGLLKEIDEYKHMRKLRYNNSDFLIYSSKEETLKNAILDYEKYNNDIFVIAAFIIKDLNF